MEMIEYVIEMLETEMMEYVIEMQKEMLDIPYYRYYHLHCDLMSLVGSAKSEVDVEKIFTDPVTLTRFLLDCTSQNLENNARIAACDPTVEDIFVRARHIINAIHCERIRQIKLMKTTPG